MEVEHVPFIPFVSSASVGMSPAASEASMCLASHITEERKTPYNVMICWLRTHLGLTLPCAAIIGLRGECGTSRKSTPSTEIENIDLALAEGRLSFLSTLTQLSPNHSI